METLTKNEQENIYPAGNFKMPLPQRPDDQNGLCPANRDSPGDGV